MARVRLPTGGQSIHGKLLISGLLIVAVLFFTGRFIIAGEGQNNELLPRTLNTVVDTGEFDTVIFTSARTTIGGVLNNPIPFDKNGTVNLGLQKRAMDEEEWDQLVCAGEHVISMNDKPSYQEAKQYCETYAPSWVPKMSTQWENPGFQETYGWDTIEEASAIKNLHVNRIWNMLEHYKLSTDAQQWVMRRARHSRTWTGPDGQQHAASTGFFSYLVNKRSTRSAVIWTAMFSPDYMIKQMRLQTIPPPLRSYNGANPNGGSQIPPPKIIVIRLIHEDTTVEFLREIKRRQNDNNPRTGGKKWPGDKFSRDDEAFNVLMISPMGQAITWFLTQHKHIFGAKSVGRIRTWSTTDAEDDFNMLFEIIDPPPPESDGEAAAGSDPPLPDIEALNIKRNVTRAFPNQGHTVIQRDQRMTLARRHLRHNRLYRPHRRLRRDNNVAVKALAVGDVEWNSWICFGRAIYDLMTAFDDDAAAKIAQDIPLLEKWRGRTRSQWLDPRALAHFGWVVADGGEIDDTQLWMDTSLASTPGLNANPDDWIDLETEHKNVWQDTNGRSRLGSKGRFQGYYFKNEQTPAIVLADTWSPKAMIEQLELSTIVPPLRLMSDIVFLTYYQFWLNVMRKPVSLTGGSNVPPLKYIFIAGIIEDEATEKIYPEIGRRGNFPRDDSINEDDFFNTYPGTTFTPTDANPEYFYALLYTKQIRSLSAMLFNHKPELGPRRINAITLWSSEYGGWHFRLEMEDSPEPPAPRTAPPRAAARSLNNQSDGAAFARTPSYVRRDSLVFEEAHREPGRTSLVVYAKQVSAPNAKNVYSSGFLSARTVAHGLASLADRMDQEEWQAYVCIGELMLGFLLAPTNEAMQEIVDRRGLTYWRGKTVSPWKDTAALDFYGWTIEQHDSDREAKVQNLEQYFRLFGVNTPIDGWYYITNKAARAYQDSHGISQPPAQGAYYKYLFNLDEANPLLVVTHQFSPQARDKFANIFREPPLLSRFSDVMFVTYSYLWTLTEEEPQEGPAVPCPKTIIIDTIINSDSTKTIYEVMAREGMPNKLGVPLPGIRFTPESEKFKALLGVPQGRGIAMFLFQHKAAFGVKTVKAIRVVKGPFFPSLVFEVGDPPPPPPPPPPSSPGGVVEAEGVSEESVSPPAKKQRSDLIRIRAKL